MTKRQTLESIQLLLEQQQLPELLAEVAAHGELLGYAELACELGQQGAVPAGWPEEGGGQVFDAHAVVFDALMMLPGGGAFSPALLEYLDELPRQQQVAHDQVMEWLRDSARRQPGDTGPTLLHSALLDDWNRQAGQPTRLFAEASARLQADGSAGPSPLAGLTDQQAGRYSMLKLAQLLEQTSFAEAYAADVARARELARQRGEWSAILDCLA